MSKNKGDNSNNQMENLSEMVENLALDNDRLNKKVNLLEKVFLEHSQDKQLVQGYQKMKILQESQSQPENASKNPKEESKENDKDKIDEENVEVYANVDNQEEEEELDETIIEKTKISKQSSYKKNNIQAEQQQEYQPNLVDDFVKKMLQINQKKYKQNVNFIPVINIEQEFWKKIIKKIENDKLTLKFMIHEDPKLTEINYDQGKRLKSKFKPKTYKYTNAVGLNQDLSEFILKPLENNDKEEDQSKEEEDQKQEKQKKKKQK